MRPVETGERREVRELAFTAFHDKAKLISAPRVRGQLERELRSPIADVLLQQDGAVRFDHV